MEKIRNSWELIKASARVLAADKELIIFPIVSTISVIIVMATFAFPMFLTGFFESIFEGGGEIMGAVVGFLFYVAQYFVIIFFNSALIGAALIRLRGGDPTVGDGLRIALNHIASIFGYAIFAATVGMILRWISERGGILGRIGSFIGGLAWSLATYLVVPVLVVEEVNPWEAVKRSTAYLKQTWGEQIVGNFSIGTIFGLVYLVVFLIGIPFIIWVSLTLESLPIIILFIVTFIMVLVVLGLISSTLNGIYVAAVYLYASDGETGAFFSDEMVRGAFRPK